MLYYALPPLTILKTPNTMDQLACLEKITLVQGRDCPTQRSWASKAPTDLSSHRFDDKDYENPLRPNKPGVSEAFTRSS